MKCTWQTTCATKVLVVVHVDHLLRGAGFSLIDPDHPQPGASSPVQFVEQAVHIAAACSPHRNGRKRADG